MKDILLNSSGDLFINPETADIQITDSVEQAIRIRLLWFFKEWRLSPELGVPYYEDVLIKNPSHLRIQQIFRDEILSVDEVTDVTTISVDVNPDRRAIVRYTAQVEGGSTIIDEVILHG